MTEYGYTVEVPEGYDEAVIRSRLALRAEGFSILSQMHVGGLIGPATAGERQYLIMSYWNTAVLEERIGSDLNTGVHLPCNVVVQESDSGAIVAALDPADTADQGGVSEEMLDAARQALTRMLAKVERPEP
ncbi:MAG TPA: DUF302 domain-containing protein [Actinomycetota bacterium]|nr:DUF302 domain-containing protein [Actinomycetota bacterium]